MTEPTPPVDESARAARVARAMRESEDYARAREAIEGMTAVRAVRLARNTPEATIRDGELALGVILLELGATLLRHHGAPASAVRIVANAVKA